MMMMMAKYISLNNRLTEQVSQGWLREQQIVSSHLTRIPVCHHRWRDWHGWAESPHAFWGSCHCQPRQVEIVQKLDVLTVKMDCWTCLDHPREQPRSHLEAGENGRHQWARVPGIIEIPGELHRSVLCWWDMEEEVNRRGCASQDRYSVFECHRQAWPTGNSHRNEHWYSLGSVPIKWVEEPVSGYGHGSIACLA